MQEIDPADCPFCKVPDDEIVASNMRCYARWDKFPVSEGHILIISFRHFADYFEANGEEVTALWQLIHQLKPMLDRRFSPAGYNVGVNVGAAAGQSVPHLHVHMIPRYQNDVTDPYGGIRGVVVEKTVL